MWRTDSGLKPLLDPALYFMVLSELLDKENIY